MSEVRLSVRSDGVAVLTLAAPSRRNALTVAMADELFRACEAIDADDSVGAVVLAGEGPDFCAGADRALLADAGKDPSADQTFTAINSIYALFTRIARLQPPTIAVVQGSAVGAGVNLALSTDLRIVATDAVLISGFMRIGLHPGGGHLSLVMDHAGREAAAAMALFGQPVSGPRAVELGLAWAALPSEALLPTALDMAQQAGADPELSRHTATSLHLEAGPPRISWETSVPLEHAVQMWSLRRRDGHFPVNKVAANSGEEPVE
jgi:enoyl-CoA hydratase